VGERTHTNTLAAFICHLNNTHNNKLATYHSWFAIPFSRNERMPNNVPRYLHLDLPKHVMRNISRFRLRAHTLKIEAAAWLEDGSCVCDQCPGEDEYVQNEVHALLFCQDHRVCELRKHFSFLFTPFFEVFTAAQPFLLQQVTTNLFMISFLSRTLDFFFFFLSLWIYLWLAETSQQPISQTTWLKVTPHCNHCNHMSLNVFLGLARRPSRDLLPVIFIINNSTFIRLSLSITFIRHPVISLGAKQATY